MLLETYNPGYIPAFCPLTLTSGVQVPNNHVLLPNMYYNYYYLSPMHPFHFIPSTPRGVFRG